MPPRVERTLIVAGCVLLALPLVAHAYAGTASRYVGDDYCAGYIFRDEGLLGGQRWFYLNWGAVPSVVALMALTDPGGARLVPWLPSVAVITWVAAVAWAVRWLSAATHDRCSIAVSLLVAELLVFATLQDTPNVIQSLYLRVPMLAYVGPLIVLSFYLGFLARAVTRSASGTGTAAGIAGSSAFAFIGGSFGPVFVAMQTTALAIAVASAKLLPTSQSGRMKQSRPALLRLLTAGLVGSVAALAFVALAPGNFIRQQAFPNTPAPSLIVKWSLLSAGFMFVRPALPLLRPAIEALAPRLWGDEPRWLERALAMSTSPLTLLLLVSLPAALALGRSSGDARSSQRAVVALMAIPVAAFVLVLASMVPGAYGTSAPPPPRALVIPQFAITCLVACWGYALGTRLRGAASDRARTRLTGTCAVAAAAVIVVTTSVSLVVTLRRAAELRVWSASWDAVDRQLRAVHNAGARQAVVPAIGDVGGVGSIAVDAGDWVNTCAAQYYGFDRIMGVAVRQ